MLNKPLVNLGKRIRSLRKSKGITLEKLGELADMSPKYIGQIERAEVNVTMNTLNRISSALDLNLSDFFVPYRSGRKLADKEMLLNDLVDTLATKDMRTIKFVYETLRQGFDLMEKAK